MQNQAKVIEVESVNVNDANANGGTVNEKAFVNRTADVSFARPSVHVGVDFLSAVAKDLEEECEIHPNFRSFGHLVGCSCHLF